MGVCFLQHRVTTGKFNSKKLRCKYSMAVDVLPHGSLRGIFYTIGLVVYGYILCILLAMVVDTPGNANDAKFVNVCYLRGWGAPYHESRECFNSWFILILTFLLKFKFDYVSGLIKYHCYTGGSKNGFQRMSLCSRISNFISLWLTILNLLLIIISNTSLLNPGPEINNISVLYQNVRGFVPFSALGEKVLPLDTDKILEFQGYVFHNKPDILILNETWLSKEHFDNEIIPDKFYKIFRVDRSPKTHPIDPNNPNKFRRRGGGILIGVRTDLDIESKEVKINSKAEILSIELKLDEKFYICLTTCYRVGTLGQQNHKEIDKHLRAVGRIKKYSKHVIIGDFNLSQTSWIDTNSQNTLEQSFIDTFHDLALKQMIQCPTHEKGNVLDILVTTTPEMIKGLKVLDKNDICSSDHFGIQFKMGYARRKKSKRKLLNYKKANWQDLNRDINSVKWDYHLKYCEAELAWHKFKNILFHLINKHIPTVTIKNNDQPPWFDNETYKLCRKKERLRSKFKRTQCPTDYSNYAKCRKEYKSLVKNKMLCNLNDESDPALISKKFWTHLKSTTGTSRIPETVSYNNRFRNNPQDQAELFNTYFADQFSDPSNYDIDVDFTNDTLNGIDISHQRVRSLLKKVNINKTAGPDGIHGKILKHCASSIAYPLSLIFKTSYNTGYIPKEWKLANVVPVHKKGSKASAENYRPISLTCLVMKIFEKVIRDELMSKCENLINESQHGFLPSKSCTTQLISFTDSLALSLNGNYRTDVVYFDFAKAFDSVNHDIILSKLKHHFQIDGILLKFLVNYLQDRQQCVVVGGHKSDLKSVQSGVPQGSILGPLLFVLFINDMSTVISKDTNIALYADDTKIWRQITSWNDHIVLQNDIEALHEWSTRNKMRFHPQKCKVMSVTPFGRDPDNNMSTILPFQNFIYSLNGIELQFVNSEKDLGILVTSRLTWNEQCQALYQKASLRMGLLKRTLYFTKCQKKKRSFYLALVRSQFEHCVQVWRPNSVTMCEKLERIQRRAVKWILSEPDHHYNDIEYLARLRDLDLLPLRYRFMFSDLVLFHKIYNNDSCIKLPSYLQPFTDADRNRLRSNIRPPTYFQDSTTINLDGMRSNRYDELSLKCTVNPRASALKNNFFFRTCQLWNTIPVNIRSSHDSKNFKTKLCCHLWDMILAPD